MELVQDSPVAVLAAQIPEEHGRIRSKNIEISGEEKN
jgi:hypothetical protein